MKVLLTTLLIASTLSSIAQDKPKKTKAKVNGNISSSFNYYDSNRPILRNLPYGYSLSASLNLKYGQLSLPFSAVLTERGSSFSQPFSRFGISPKYKWATFHFGHRNFRYGQFALDGITSLGAGVSLKPGKFKIEAMAGRFREATNLQASNYLPPQFERKGYSALIGYGKKSYIDFMFFHAQDDSSSIHFDKQELPQLTAKNNSILATKNKLQFFKGKVQWKNEGGLSIHTANLNAQTIGDSSVYDVIPKKVADFVDLNISTHVAGAGESELGLYLNNVEISGKYRYVQDDYRSLGVNYIVDDIEQITLNSSVSLLQNKMMISGSIGKERNNLSSSREDNTSRLIGALSLNITPNTKLNTTLSYSGFSINQQIVTDNIFLSDTFRINQSTQSFSVNQLLNLGDSTKIRQLLFTGNYQLLNDKVEISPVSSDNELINANVNFIFGNLKTNWNFNSGLIYTTFFTQQFDVKRYGINTGVSKKIRKNLNLSLKGYYLINVTNGEQGNLANASFRVGYKPHKKHRLLASFGIFSSTGIAQFLETRTNISYNVTL